MSTKKRNDKGFTLIELIIVIVILGIIAGVAVPKFIGLASSAKIAEARGVGGALSSTIALKHANYLLNQATYTWTDVRDDTAFAGGITTGSFSGTLPSVILDYKGTDFTWNYVGRSGETTAYLEEIPGSGFPSP